ncbi:unnamed protein product [Gadus morhua 'NCC']
METTQTWKSQESGAVTEGSLRERQDNPAPAHSGTFNKKGKTVLYAQIPPQNQVNEFVFAVISDNQPLCALTFSQSGIEESGDWERMLYGKIDWSDTKKETGM